MKVLEVKDLGINFGGLRALDNLNLEIDEQALVGLIGPNGAGKTTVFNLLSGLYKPSDGTIHFLNQKVNKLNEHQRANLGISRTFQNIRLFKNLTVIDNVKIGMHKHIKYHFWDSLLKTKKYYEIEKKINDEAFALLKIFNLDSFQNTLAKNLPYGKQRELEIVRALANRPKLLLLDEPAAGMNSNETQELMNLIRKIRDEFKMAILLIEHDMHLVTGICEKVYVLNYGMLLTKGKASDVIKDPSVIKAYLGD